MSQRKLRLAIAKLRRAGIVKEQIRPGLTTVRTVTDPEEWQPMSCCAAHTPAPDARGIGTGRKGTPVRSCRPPLSPRADKGYPYKEIHEGIPIKESAAVARAAHKGGDRPRNLFSDHPAIQAFRAVTKRYPLAATYELVIEVLGSTPDVNQLRACFNEWCVRGFKPTNLAWCLEWYVNGIPQKEQNRNGRKYQKSHSDTLDAFNDQLENLGGTGEDHRVDLHEGEDGVFTAAN